MKTTLWLCTSALALLGCGAATAQTGGGTAADTSKPNGSVVQEVVVTAERRATNLQQTPIAATVFTGAQLLTKGVYSVEQLQFVSPSLTVNNFGQGNDFNIRGIGKGESNSQTTVGVITYRDGVATFPGYFQDEPYYDISNIEILRGPQGTFAGQNATGGAVFITETDPTFNGMHGYLSGSFGNYSDTAVQGAVNLPITDNLAARVAFNDEYRDSFYQITGPHTGDPGLLRESSARLSLLWKPNSDLTVSLKTDYSYIDQGGYAADPVNSTNNLFKITNNAPNLAIDQFVRTVLRMDYSFADGITLRSISGFQQGVTAEKADLDGTSTGDETFRDRVPEQIYSQELDLISPDRGPFTWIAGAYYQHNTYTFPYKAFDIGDPPGGFDIDISGANVQTTTAAFGQVSYAITSNLQLQIGARYSYATTENKVVTDLVLGGAFDIPVPDYQSQDESKLTGKVALNWKVNDDNFVYAFVATGHKAGGLNTATTAVLPPSFKGEDVTDYEAGWKANAFEGHLKTQLGGYYDIYDRFQVTIGNPLTPTVNLEINAPTPTHIYGVEGSAQAVFGALSFDTGISLLHSELGDFYAADPRLGATAACNPISGPAGGGCVDLTGHRQDYAPDFTLNVGGQYVFDLPGGDTITPRLNFSHTSQQWATLFEDSALGDSLSARDLLSAQLAWRHGGLVVTAYGSNLTNLHYVTQINSGLRFAGAPLQFGVRAVESF